MSQVVGQPQTVAPSVVLGPFTAFEVEMLSSQNLPKEVISYISMPVAGAKGVMTRPGPGFGWQLTSSMYEKSEHPVISDSQSA